MINGVPYPAAVRDEKSFLAWIASIERSSEDCIRPWAIDRTSTEYTYLPMSPASGHREIYRSAHFHRDDPASEALAKAIVCQHMAMELFSHLIHAPHGKIVWRIRPEFDVQHDTIPSDLSQTMSRNQIDAEFRAHGFKPVGPVPLTEAIKALGKEDWGINFCTDSIFPVAAPTGEWRLFKSYMRYSVVLGDEVISPRGIAA